MTYEEAVADVLKVAGDYKKINSTHDIEVAICKKEISQLRDDIKNIVEMYGYDVWDIRKVQNSQDTQKIVITYDYGRARDPLDSFEVSLPFFDNDTMFTGMKLNKDYTLEELGIEVCRY